MLKSIFISFYISLCTGLLVYTLFLLTKGNVISTLATTLMALLVLAFFARFFLVKTPRTVSNPKEMLLLLSVLWLFSIFWRFTSNDVDLFYFSTSILIGWILYIRWYSVFPKRNKEKLLVGNSLNDLQMIDVEGKSWSKSDLEGSYNILLFYRGNWCPFCTAQIHEMASQYQTLKDLNSRVIFISPQSLGKTKNLAQKLNIPAVFVVDTDNFIAKKFDLVQSFGTPFGMQILGYKNDVPMPTLVVTDPDLQIIYADLTDNYRVRPEPDTFLEIIRKNKNS